MYLIICQNCNIIKINSTQRMNIAMEKKVNLFVKIFPWYYGLLADLLFYIAIDTLFLTMVKNFSPAQVVSLTAFSQFACIALQFPILFVIKKIGNTNSARMRGLCMLVSAILITVGKNFHLVLLGRIFHDVAAIFGSASVVALENNLDLVGRRNDFVRVRTAGNTVYAVITMLISFVASLMFNLNNYIKLSKNEPDNTFSDDVELKAYGRGMGGIGLPGDLSSMSRFVRASFVKLNSVCDETETEAVSQFFHILYSVFQQKGCSMTENGPEITNYTSCCNTDKGIYYYTTYNNLSINAIDMNRENLNKDELIKFNLIKTKSFHKQN